MRRFKIILLTAAVGVCAFAALPAQSAGATDVFHDTDACDTPAAQKSPACKATGADPITGQSGVLYRGGRILSIVAGIAAVVAIIIGGFMYVTAGGEANKAANARKVITGALIGLLVIILANSFVALIINLVE